MLRSSLCLAIVLGVIVTTVPGVRAAETVNVRLKGSDSGPDVPGRRGGQCRRLDPLALRLCRALSERRARLPLQARFRRRLPASESRDRRRRELDLRQRAVACRYAGRAGAPQGPRLRVLADARGPQSQSPRDARLPALVLPGLDPRAVLARRHRLVRGVPGSGTQAIRHGSRLGWPPRRTRTAPTATGSSTAFARRLDRKGFGSVKIQAPDCDKQFWASLRRIREATRPIATRSRRSATTTSTAASPGRSTR